MKFGSVCSGIEAASVAWKPLGWKASFFSEIEKFPSELLATHYPDVPNYGDMTKYKEWKDEPVGLIVGGTPCQSFSVAGLRRGLEDPRGNLMLTFGGILKKYQPTWMVWENVPGVLSSNKGRDFGTFLGMLGQCRYGFAYRVLDAQYFGVAQRRRRVFVVGYLGDWKRAAAVLFESESLQGDLAKGRKKGKVAPTLPASGSGTSRTGNAANEGSWYIPEKCPTLTANLSKQVDNQMLGDAGAWFHVTYDMKQHHNPQLSDTVQLTTRNCSSVRGDTPLTVRQSSFGGWTDDGKAGTIKAAGGAGGGGSENLAISIPENNMVVRRLTPNECEVLQGFPRDYTDLNQHKLMKGKYKPDEKRQTKQTADGPRYKALGNSMAVPVMRWIGERIQQVEETWNG